MRNKLTGFGQQPKPVKTRIEPVGPIPRFQYSMSPIGAYLKINRTIRLQRMLPSVHKLLYWMFGQTCLCRIQDP